MLPWWYAVHIYADRTGIALFGAGLFGALRPIWCAAPFFINAALVPMVFSQVLARIYVAHQKLVGRALRLDIKTEFSVQIDRKSPFLAAFLPAEDEPALRQVVKKKRGIQMYYAPEHLSRGQCTHPDAWRCPQRCS